MKKLIASIVLVLTVLMLAACRVQASADIPSWIKLTDTFQAFREVRDLVFSPDSQILFAASGNFFAGNIQSWEVSSGDPFHFYHDYSGAVMAIGITPDGQTLVSASQDGNIRLWGVTSAKVNTVLPGNGSPLRSVAISNDGLGLASGARDGTVRLWGAGFHDIESTWANHQVNVSGLAFSKDGRWLASSDGLALFVWDKQTRKATSLLPQDFPDQAYGLAFSPAKASWLAFGSDMGKVYLWDIETQTTLRMFQARSGYLLWDVAFSPDGTLLAAGNSDGTTVIWETETGRQLAVLPSGTGGISAIAFSTDGAYLAAGGSNKTIRIWTLNLGSLAIR